jgi:hypothetical protein
VLFANTDIVHDICLRESYEVPSRCNEDDNGERRRRLMRQIEQVLATQDGGHALALCTDGGVLYYHASAEDTYRGATEPVKEGGVALVEANVSSGIDSNEKTETKSGCDDISRDLEVPSDSGELAITKTDSVARSPPAMLGKRFGQIVEFQHLTREVELGPKFMTDNAWCLKRVGKRGVVILIRACQGVSGDDDEPRGAVLDVSILSELAPIEVGDTSLEESVNWSMWKYYHDNSATVGWDIPKPIPEVEAVVEEADNSAMKSKSSTRGRPPTGKTTKVKSLPGSTPRQDKARQEDSGGAPSKRQRTGFSTPVLAGTESPGQAVGRRVDHISPHDNALPPRAPKSSSSTSQARKQCGVARDSVAETSNTGCAADLGQVSKRLYTSYVAEDTGRKTGKFDSVSLSDSDESETEQSQRPVVIPRPGPAPLVKRTRISDAIDVSCFSRLFIDYLILCSLCSHGIIFLRLFWSQQANAMPIQVATLSSQ